MNPLDQLADIAIPADVSAWPPALGYWIVLGLAILLAVASAVFFYRRNARRLALKESLAALQSINFDDHLAMQQVHHVLKTAVQSYLPEKNILQMQTEQWADLISKLYGSTQSESACQPLIQLAKWQYDQRLKIAEPQVIKTAAQTWLKKALPPNKGAVDV
ncbi:DUF4381 domain-containing protein [Glaciecola sp. SC05]|uniref:DUF4381 domain-containing protein n=1 Tax=Glaciecola sp. SC05 TaxID=1987355 RepID=UPI003528047E